MADKPAELLTVPGRRPEHQDCLYSRLQLIFKNLLIVHRLDMSTSGLIVLAKTPDTQKILNKQFENRQVFKTYHAVIKGKPEHPSGTIDLPLICDWPNRPRQIVDHESGKPAHTNYRFISYDAERDASLVELKPTSGRTHQLRVHMQAIGHPILGDDLYADPPTLAKSDRLLLHASTLAFTHPKTGVPVSFTQEAPF